MKKIGIYTIIFSVILFPLSIFAQGTATDPTLPVGTAADPAPVSSTPTSPTDPTGTPAPSSTSITPTPPKPTPIITPKTVTPPSVVTPVPTTIDSTPSTLPIQTSSGDTKTVIIAALLAAGVAVLIFFGLKAKKKDENKDEKKCANIKKLMEDKLNEITNLESRLTKMAKDKTLEQIKEMTAGSEAGKLLVFWEERKKEYEKLKELYEKCITDIEKKIKILIIADIHYGEDSNYPKHKGGGYVNSFGSQFEKFLPKIHSLIKESDLIINLGDLISEVDASFDLENYKKALKLLEVGKPVKHILGNHDVRHLTREKLVEVIGEKNPYYSFDLSGYHHIVLDSFKNLRNEPCRITEEQISWLKEDLNKTKLSTIVYCHYPLDNQSIDNNYYFAGKPERAFIENKQEVRKIFELSGRVLAVFSGHLHFFHEEKINNIKYITAPSFSENNGNHKPKTECLNVELKNKEVRILVKNLYQNTSI